MKNRPHIPQKTADNLMFSNDHTCCICRQKGKHVQIHHIDGDDLNNNPTNLAILCMECHSKVTGNEGLGRSYTSGEILQYKKTWELITKRKLFGKRIEHEARNKDISYCELTVCEILAMEDGDPRIREKIETLYQLNIITGRTDEILNALFHLSFWSPISQKQTSILLSDFIYQLFWHFVGPETISLRKHDVNRLEQGVNLLGTIGEFSGEFSKDIGIIHAVCDNLSNLYSIALWYNVKKIGEMIIIKLNKTKEACLSVYEDSKKQLIDGAQYVDDTLLKMRKDTQQQNSNWNSIFEFK